MKDILMPRLGNTMTEGCVNKWYKAEGETIAEGDSLFELSCNGKTYEIEAPVSGVVSKILVIAGAIVPVKEKIAEMTEGEVSAPAVQPVSEKTPGKKPSEAAPMKASPLAAKVAEKIGMNLANVPAHGRVLAQDILTYLEKQTSVPAAEEKREETVPMSGMRKVIAKNMLTSHMISPTVTYNTSVDMLEMKRYREQLKSKDIKVSYTDILVKFVAKALMEFPQLNCSLVENQLIYKHYVNMGIAVALDKGLVVPNVTDAEKKSLTEISAEVKALAKASREGTLSVDKMKNGTFTITNLGMYGIESFSPIINQPEVAILGVTAMIDTPVVRSGEVVICPIMNLSLTADHRVVDGSVAAEFLQRVKALLENPALMLA